VPFNRNPPNALLAIATDLLAQAEAQHRAASRFEQSVRQQLRDRQSVVQPTEQIRQQLRAMRDLFDAERILLDEVERELSTANR
jgi:hypothetical protein